jgi:UDP-arabinose 4-epimerase
MKLNRDRNAFMARTILVTGGAGYIGSQTCKELAQAGFSPVVYDNLVFGHEWATRWGPLERGDCTDRERLEEVMNKYKPSAVIHFAAYAYVGESVTDPAKYYHNNVVGSLTVLEAMVANNIPSIVFSSSCATYGIPQKVPISESAAQNPINPYGRSKLMIEQILADFSAAYDIHYAALRYFNASGADPEGEIGEEHDPETHLIPRVLMVAAGRMPSIEVFGADYDTPDGTCIRDYIHVFDLAKGHLSALDYIEREKTNLQSNLGTGYGVSVHEIIDAAEEVTGREIPLQIGRRRTGDPSELVCDPSKAARVLGWRPQIPDVKTHIEHAWRWMRGG